MLSRYTVEENSRRKDGAEMRSRDITTEQAKAVLTILKDECGYTADPHNGAGFIQAVSTEGKSAQGICAEYRFIGALGFGGKFRNNGNNGNTPYVDCYPENETPARVEMIARANARLNALFNVMTAASDAEQGLLR